MRTVDLPYVGNVYGGIRLRPMCADAVSKMELYTIRTGRPHPDADKFIAFLEAVKAGVEASKTLPKMEDKPAEIPDPIQVTLQLKNFAAGDSNNPVTTNNIFVSATDGEGKVVSVNEALAGVTIPNTLGKHTITVTYTDGTLKDGTDNTVTETCEVDITTSLKAVTLVMKDFTVEEGTAVKLTDVFTSCTDAEGKPVTAANALRGLTLPTAVGVHPLTHTYVGTEIRGVANDATGNCTVTITEKEEEVPAE